MAETVAVMLGDGFEPVEVVAPVDVLRRGGVDVTLVSVMGRKEVTSAQDIKMVADALVEDVDLDLFTMVVVPGGSVGVENLGKCDKLAESLRDRMKANLSVLSALVRPFLQTSICCKAIKQFATQDAKLISLLGSISQTLMYASTRTLSLQRVLPPHCRLVAHYLRRSRAKKMPTKLPLACCFRAL